MRWCPDGDFFASCIFIEPRAARFRPYLKFALRPHHVWEYGTQSATAEIRQGKKEEETTVWKMVTKTVVHEWHDSAGGQHDVTHVLSKQINDVDVLAELWTELSTRLLQVLAMCLQQMILRPQLITLLHHIIIIGIYSLPASTRAGEAPTSKYQLDLFHVSGSRFPWHCARHKLRLLHFARGIAEAEIYIGHGHLCVCLSVPRPIPTLLHGPGCKLGEC